MANIYKQANIDIHIFVNSNYDRNYITTHDKLAHLSTLGDINH